MVRSVWSILTVAAMLFVCAACSREPVDLMPEAEELYLAGRYDEAIPVLRRHLVSHPDDAGAHFYLGSCYLLSSDPWLVLAEGEIETALAIFERTGKKSPIARFTDTYFELRCQLELAKVLFKQVLYLADAQGPPQFTGILIRRLDETVARAKRIDPDAPEVAQLEALVARVRYLPGLRLAPDMRRGPLAAPSPGPAALAPPRR